MPCTNNLVLAQTNASANAHFADSIPPKAIDGNTGYPNSWAANTSAASNTAPHPDTGIIGSDTRSAGEQLALTVSLGGVQCVQAIELQWNYPGERAYKFTLWTSTDGNVFAQQGGDRESGGLAASGTWESSDIGGVQASHYEVRPTGNTVNDWAVINEARALGDQLVTPPNGYTVIITGNGANQSHDIYAVVGENTVPITPEPALAAGTYSYTISGPNVTSCTGNFSVQESGLERRCITHAQPVTPGENVSLSLSDFDDGEGGTPTRFVVVQQPAVGSIVVSADGQTLTVSLPASAVGASNGKVDVEYNTSG